ncbi:MAG: hypothetical protein AAFY03_11410, partial [Pseudomonadota bacterium]
GTTWVVPYITGFRMSFRRNVIAKTGFDETLRKYGWFEDIDASWCALQHGILVGSDKARIYHHRVAAARAGGHRMGLWAILNRGYIVMKHVHANPKVFPKPSRETLRLGLYCRARAMAYRLMARDTFGKDRAKGAADGLVALPKLTAASAKDLPGIYSSLEAD